MSSKKKMRTLELDEKLARKLEYLAIEFIQYTGDDTLVKFLEHLAETAEVSRKYGLITLTVDRLERKDN
jgi:hypothetical protein